MNWGTNNNWNMKLGSTPYGTAAAPAAAPGPAAAAEPEQSFVIDVGDADFETRVLELSMQLPVLVDCWAPWCAPCKSLGPVLEKLAKEYGGRFVLAKLNTDEAPQIAAALRIRSIPQCFLFVQGRPVDQFTGALPEGKLREFLDKHVGPVVDEVQAIRDEAAQAEPEAAEALLREALTYEPGHAELTLDLAERLVARGALDEAQTLLDGIATAERTARHAPLEKRIELARKRPQGDRAALAARVAANPKDFEARFALAAWQVYEGDYRGAFEQLLDVVLRDKAEHREQARKQLVEWFDACPDAEAVSYGRRYLGMYLN
jgi:putative thioredoxin